MDLSSNLNGNVIPKVYSKICAYLTRKPTANKHCIKAPRVNRNNKPHVDHYSCVGGNLFGRGCLTHFQSFCRRSVVYSAPENIFHLVKFCLVGVQKPVERNRRCQAKSYPSY